MDPEQLAFELDALGTAVNSGWQLTRTSPCSTAAWRAIASRLGHAATDTGSGGARYRRCVTIAAYPRGHPDYGVPTASPPSSAP